MTESYFQGDKISIHNGNSDVIKALKDIMKCPKSYEKCNMTDSERLRCSVIITRDRLKELIVPLCKINFR